MQTITLRMWPSEPATFFGSAVEVDGMPIISPPSPSLGECVGRNQAFSGIMEMFAVTLCQFKSFCLDLLGHTRLMFLLAVIKCCPSSICYPPVSTSLCSLIDAILPPKICSFFKSRTCFSGVQQWRFTNRLNFGCFYLITVR